MFKLKPTAKKDHPRKDDLVLGYDGALTWIKTPCVSPNLCLAGQQFNIGLIAISAVLLLPSHLPHDPQILKRLDCGVGSRECCFKFLSNLLDGEPRHHW